MPYRVYVSQTNRVVSDIELLDVEEIELANTAVRSILDEAVCDARDDKLRAQYAKRVGHVTVAGAAWLKGNRIEIVIVHVSTGDDWDPNGGKGLDDIAYSNTREIAKAFATIIGGQVTYRWFGPRNLQLECASVPESGVDSGLAPGLRDVRTIALETNLSFRIGLTLDSCNSAKGQRYCLGLPNTVSTTFNSHMVSSNGFKSHAVRRFSHCDIADSGPAPSRKAYFAPALLDEGEIGDVSHSNRSDDRSAMKTPQTDVEVLETPMFVQPRKSHALNDCGSSRRF